LDQDDSCEPSTVYALVPGAPRNFTLPLGILRKDRISSSEAARVGRGEDRTSSYDRRPYWEGE
jgi:hypothetical protein